MNKQLYCFHLHPFVESEQVWQLLEEKGIEVLYATEDTESCIYGYGPHSLNLNIKFIHHYEKATLPTIDWEQQWANHGWHFQEGMVQLPLAEYGFPNQTLKLIPGPGFGDLSHITTRLVLKLLPIYLKQQPVIDVGCGSGVLGLAAILMGASCLYGIDIDDQALQHATMNAELNYLCKQCYFYQPDQLHLFSLKESPLITMNMIFSEQKEALNRLSNVISLKSDWIISGILKSERDQYLYYAQNILGQLIHEEEEEGWCAFIFSC